MGDLFGKFVDITGLAHFLDKVKEWANGVFVQKQAGKGLSTNDYTTPEKDKLTNIAENANNYAHPNGSGNKHVPSGGSSGQFLKWSADGTATWAADNNTTYSKATASADGLESKEHFDKVEKIEAGAQVNKVEAIKVNGVAVPVSGKVASLDLTGYATKADISSVYKYKGTVANYAALPTENLTRGDVYNASDNGANYAYVGEEDLVWDKLSDTVDTSVFIQRDEIAPITNAEIDALFV